MGAFLRSVPRLARQGVRDLLRHPLAQGLTLLTVALVVLLCGLMLMLLATVDSALSGPGDETVIQVYWRQDTDVETARSQWQQLGHLPWLVRHTTYTPEQALAALGTRLGPAGTDLTFLGGKNPLPPSAILYFSPLEDDYGAWLDQTRAHLAGLPGVEQVILNPLQTEMGASWRLLSRRVMIPSLALLALMLALIVGTTIRLSLASRAAEIEILQLVGAQNWYIRLPLLMGGGLIGLLGGLAGLGLTWLVWRWLSPLVCFPPLLPRLVFPGATVCAALACAPPLMGVIGSALAVRTPLARAKR